MNVANFTGNRRGIKQTERLAIAAAWGNRCAYCEKPVDTFEIDHIVAHAKGGTCELENLCVSCHSCNRRKSASPLPEMYEGLLLSLAARKVQRIEAKLAAATQKASKPKAATVAKKPKVEMVGEEEYITRQNGMAVLRRIFYLGLTEESYPRNINLLPAQVECISQPLDCSFFEQLGLTHREVVDGLASLLLEYRDEGGSGCDSLNFSCTTSAKDGSCVFAFYKSAAELALYFWRLRNLSHEQVGVAA